MDYQITVNGTSRTVSARPETPLLYVLMNDLNLKGPRFGCGLAQCGSCSVLLDGELVCACLVLAAQADGHEVVTVEGLGAGDLHPVQQAFVDAGAVQCGFCTPGLVVATAALLERVPEPSEYEIREALSGNLCRCTGYTKIFDAVRLAARR
jgi:carbon-monoxide dehydrogenase small subunit